ncbi:hypothetical protein B0H66DRAFT_630773 [Apodospora peruviana]|uniref:Uncharacterized protein n=1 Tax=Apodospora peruviana TaxID=516989 RepID=A0AAE0M072_9PEZI|nr:hypothetical protein B0H66DRAFT_630773 [Apodospora peruviana]
MTSEAHGVLLWARVRANLSASAFSSLHWELSSIPFGTITFLASDSPVPAPHYSENRKLTKQTIDVSEYQLFQCLQAAPQPASQSILLSVPSSAFVSLWCTVPRMTTTTSLQDQDILSANIALATIVAKFTAIPLPAIPFRNTIT